MSVRQECIGILFALGMINAYAISPAGPFSSDQYTVALWHFNEGTGDRVSDASGNGNHGRITGARWVDGKFGAGLLFSGIDSVNVVDKPSLHVQAVTIEAWVYSENFGAAPHGVIVSKEYGNMASYRLQNYDGVGHVSMVTNNNWGNHITTTQPLTNNAWHYVAGVAATGYYKVYIDGVLAASAPRTIAMSYDASPLLIGAVRYVANECFRGIIDEVRISSIDRFSSLPPAGKLLAHWSFDSCAGTSTLYDVTGHGYDAITSGTGLTLTDGVHGRALSCPGTGYEIVASNTQTAFNRDRFSIECWYKSTTDQPTGIDNASQLMCFQNIESGVRNGYAVYINSTGNIDFGMFTRDGDDYVNAISATSLKAREWYHIVATYDSLNLNLYINGVLESSVLNGSGGYPAPGVDARIGCQRRIGGQVIQFLNGKIDEMKFYGYPLPADSIAAHYQSIAIRPRNDSVPVLVPIIPKVQTNRKPVFRWHPARGAASYKIVIDTAGDFLNPIVILPLPDTMFVPRVKLPYGKIFWKVSANTKYTRYSAVDSFRVVARTGMKQSITGNVEAGTFTAVSSGRGFHFAYATGDRASVTIQLFSMTGACVETLRSGEATSGCHTLQWNGTDRNGRAVPRGSYLVRCAIGPKVVTKKIALVR